VLLAVSRTALLGDVERGILLAGVGDAPSVCHRCALSWLECLLDGVTPVVCCGGSAREGDEENGEEGGEAGDGYYTSETDLAPCVGPFHSSSPMGGLLPWNLSVVVLLSISLLGQST